MIARFRSLLIGLVWFAATGIVILDYPALAGMPVVG
jgi:hypothetical protein